MLRDTIQPLNLRPPDDFDDHRRDNTRMPRSEPLSIELRPVPMSELGSDEPIAWSWQGYLARRHTTLLTGIWKGGKTTALTHLIHLFGKGGELGALVEPGRVLVVSEESKGLWVRRRVRADRPDGWRPV